MRSAAETHLVRTRNGAGAEKQRLDSLFTEQTAAEFLLSLECGPAGFVDDPPNTVRQVDELVAQVIQSLAPTFASQDTMITMGADRIPSAAVYPYEIYVEAGSFIDRVPVDETKRRKIAYGNTKGLYRVSKRAQARIL